MVEDEPFIHYTQVLQYNPKVTSTTLQVWAHFTFLHFYLFLNLTNDDYIDHDFDVTMRDGEIMEGIDEEHMACSMIQCSLE